MPLIINGRTDPVLQPVKVQYDPQRGLQITIPWECADGTGNNLAQYASYYQANRVAYEVETTKRKSRLIATASGGQLGIPDVSCDTWQILGNEIQKDLRELPASVAALTDAIVSQIEAGLLNNTKAADMSPALVGDAATVYDLLRRGTTHYALAQYVLRHTTNVSNVFNSNVADFNINRIYTTSQLLSETTNPLSWNFPLPGRLVYKIQNIEVPQSRSGYLWGWRKLSSTEQTSSGNRIEITTEYWLEQWSTFIYSTAV